MEQHKQWVLSENKSIVHNLFKWLVVVCFIGTAVGCASALFLISLNWVTTTREQEQFLIYFLPIIGLLIGLIYYHFGKNIQAGNNLLLTEINAPQKPIPFIITPFIFVGTLLTHLFGGSAGREGTALQMAGGISSVLFRMFKFSIDERRIIILCAISAGFASVFGTPYTAFVFALELTLIGSLAKKAIIPVVLSGFIAHFVTNLWSVPHTHYAVRTFAQFNVNLFLQAVIAGIIFGCCAYVFVKGMRVTSALFAKIRFVPVRPFLGGTLVLLAVLCLGKQDYIGLGIPKIVSSFQQPAGSADFMLKIGLTILTLSSGFKGGEVTPLFFIGATLGSSLSVFLNLPTDMLAGMGFVAVFAAATKTPIACSVMAFELFGWQCGLYAILASFMAYLVSGKESIYSSQNLGKSVASRYLMFFKK